MYEVFSVFVNLRDHAKIDNMNLYDPQMNP